MKQRSISHHINLSLNLDNLEDSIVGDDWLYRVERIKARQNRKLRHEIKGGQHK